MPKLSWEEERIAYKISNKEKDPQYQKYMEEYDKYMSGFGEQESGPYYRNDNPRWSRIKITEKAIGFLDFSNVKAQSLVKEEITDAKAYINEVLAGKQKYDKRKFDIQMRHARRHSWFETTTCLADYLFSPLI